MNYKNLKKTIAILFIVITFMCIFTIPIHADEETVKMEDMFQNGKINNLTSPVIAKTNTDTGNIIKASFIVPQEIIDLSLKHTPAFNHLYQIEDDLIVGYQIDYKIDKNDWHYNSSWDTLKYSNMNNESFINEFKMTIEPSMDVVYSTTLIDTIDNNVIGDFSSAIITGNEGTYIDFDNHTIQLRTRAFATFTPIGETRKYIFSDWSETIVPQDLTEQIPTEIPTPEIDKLYIYPENGATNFEFTTKHNPAISTILGQCRNLYGNHIDFQVKGYLIPKNENGKFDISQAIPLSLNSIDERINRGYTFLYDKGEITEIEDWSLVLKIVTSDAELSSNYSKTIAISKICLNDPRKNEEGILLEGEAEFVDRCNLCGFCPHPLGMCIFSYALIVIALIIVTVIVIMGIKRRQELIN